MKHDHTQTHTSTRSHDHDAERPSFRGHGPRGRRPLSHGEIRLLLLALVAETPCHGYDLIRRIEALSGGGYTPSPGVIYPTLAWIEDMGFATVEALAGRKSYAATDAGRAFLAEHRPEADAIALRLGATEGQGRHNAPAPVLRAMENLKLALRLRLARGTDPEDLAAIAAAIDTAALTIERT